MKIILDTKEDFHHLPHVVSFLSAIQDKPIPTNFSAPIQPIQSQAYAEQIQEAPQATESPVEPVSADLFSMFGNPMNEDPDKGDEDTGMERPSLEKSIIHQEPLPGMAAMDIVEESAKEEPAEESNGLKKIDIIEYY